MRFLPAAHTTARQKQEASAATSSSVGIGPVSSPPNCGGSSARSAWPRPVMALESPPVHSALQTAYSWASRALTGPPGSARRRPRGRRRPRCQVNRDAVARPPSTSRARRAPSRITSTSASPRAPDVPHRAHAAVAAVGEELPQHRQVADHGGQAGGLGLEHHQPEALALGGEGQQVGAAEERRHVVVGDRAEHGDVGVGRRVGGRGAPGGRARRRPPPRPSGSRRSRTASPRRRSPAARRRRCARARRRRRRAARGCPCAARCRRPRAPPGRAPQPIAAPAAARSSGQPAKRAPSTPFGITSRVHAVLAASTSAQWRLTQMRWSTSSIEARWHSASTGLAKSSTWWMVRTIDGTRPSGAQRQQRARRQAVLGVVHVGRAARRACPRRASPRSAGCAAPRPRRGACPPARGAPARAARGRRPPRRPTAPRARRRARGRSAPRPARGRGPPRPAAWWSR